MNIKKSISSLFLTGLLCVSISSTGFCDQTRSEVLKNFTDAELLQIGDKVFNTTGENTCLKCHRAGGIGEGWTGCKDLRKPWNFTSFKALGGYEAMQKDPEKFRKDMTTIQEYLLANGGIKMNMGFKKDHPDVILDWSKSPTSKGQYDMMMWGTVQKAEKDKIKEIQKDLEAQGKKLTDVEMKDLAVYSVHEYVKTFEEENKKEDGTVLPKIYGPGQK